MRQGLTVLAIGTVAFGAWSARQPSRSVALHKQEA